jgi:mono/diheme cytochrome c family protein
MFLFQILRYFQGPYEVVGTFVLPTLFFAILLFWPFLDRSPHRNPLRRPVAMTLLGAGTASLVGLTVYAVATDVRMREPAQAAARAPAAPAGPIQKLEVATLYASQCAACHGVDGTGAQLRPSMPTLPDFTSLAWQMAHTELDIAHRIVDGNEPLMPAFKNKLTQEQNLALTLYVRYFAREPDRPAASPAAQPPAVAQGPPPKALLAPPGPSQMSAGRLYGAYCLACHDADGRGATLRKAAPDMPDFTDAKWQKARGDAEIATAIRDGKGKLMLPMKDKLAAADVEQMVAFVRAFRAGDQVVKVEPKPPAPPPGKPVVVPGPPGKAPEQPRAEEVAARTRVASTLYQQYCLTCHGTDGRGAALKAAMPDIPDFTRLAWQESRENPQLAVSILDGKGALMPAFRGRVRDDQVRDLVAYVRAFGPLKAAAPAANPPSGEFEQQFRRLQLEWEALQKQLDELSRKPAKP